jgi:hypothetical protein
MRKRLFVGLGIAVMTCGAGFSAAPPTPPALGSTDQVATAAASRNNQYVFLLFSREDDAATQTVRQTLNAALAKRGGQAAVAEVRVTDPAEKALVDQYGVGGAPMPLVLAIAPNGAVTGGFPSKLTEVQVAQAFVSPAVAQCLKAVQSRKLVLLCVQPTPGAALPQGVRDFQADPQYRPATEVVTVQAGDAAEADFLKRLQVPAQAAWPVTVLLAPPGTPLGTFTGQVTKEQLIDKLKASKSCCPGGCCPGGCCGPNGYSPKR